MKQKTCFTSSGVIEDIRDSGEETNRESTSVKNVTHFT